MSRAVRRLEERLAAEARAAADAAALSDGSSDSSSASGGGDSGLGGQSGRGGSGEAGGGGGGIGGGGGGGGALNPFDLLGGSGDDADASSDDDSGSDGESPAGDTTVATVPLPAARPVAASASRGGGRRGQAATAASPARVGGAQSANGGGGGGGTPPPSATQLPASPPPYSWSAEERSPTFQASVAATMREVEELVLASVGADAAPGGRRGGKAHAGAATAASGQPAKRTKASKEAAAARRRAEAAETAALAAAIEGAPAHKGARAPKAERGRGKRGEAAAPAPLPPPTTLASLMAVEAASLSADGELKRLFGARAVAAERAAAAAADEAAGLPLPPGGGGGRRGRGGRRGAILVPPRAAAAAGATPGLGMEVIPDGERDGGQNIAAAGAPTPWRYVHSGAYAAAEAEFRAVVASGDPNGVVALLNTAPGHAGALLQLGEVYRGMGERERAAEAVERALGVLEGGFSPGYRPWGPTAPTVCLPWAAPSNRLLYRALLRYAQGLSARGLHATAWSVARVLWGLDRATGADPVGVGLCLDSLALLGGGGGWVAAAVAAPDPIGAAAPEGVPLSHHPNWALSAALGVAIGRGVGGLGPPKRGKKAKRGAEPSGSGGGGGGAAGGPVRLDMAVPAAAGDPMVAMADALLAFPMLLEPLLTVVEDRSGAASDLPFFAAVPELLAGLRDGGVLARIARIYAARSKLVWNAPAAVVLLRQAAVDANRLWLAAGRGSGGSESTVSVSAAGKAARQRVAAAEALRASAVERFVATRRYVGLVASDFVENAAALPPEALGAGGLGGGPGGGVPGGDDGGGLPPGGLEALMNALAAGGGDGGAPAVDPALLAQLAAALGPGDWGGGVPPGGGGGGGGGGGAAVAAADMAAGVADPAAARRAVLRGLRAGIDGGGPDDDDSEMSATASGDEAAAAAAAAEAAAAAAAASGAGVVAPPGAVRAGLAAAAARVVAWLVSWPPGGIAATLAVWVDRLRVALLGGGGHAHAA